MKKFLLLVVLFLGALPASAQSDCANALELTNGINTAPAVTGTFQTGCYNDTFDNTGTGTINGIWYKYTPTASGQIIISSDLTQNVSPFSTDTRLQVFTGDCSNLTCYNSADDTATNTLTTLSFNVAANTTYYFQWDNFYKSAGFYFEFTFTELTCLPVISVNSVTNTTATSITLNWDASLSAPSGYDVEYGPLGFTLGTGTTVSTTTNSVTIADLTGSTLYSYYVRANCGPTTQSAWTTVNTFTTAKILPYASGFDNDTTQLVGWSFVGNGAYSISLPSASSNAHSPLQYCILNNTVGSVSNNWLFTPAISLQQGEEVTASFWLRCATTRKLRFTVGNTATPSDQTEIWANSSLLLTSYAQQTAPVYTAPTAGIYYFAFNDVSAAATTATATLRLDTVNFATNLSTSDFLSTKFAVYPNPANDIINFSNEDNAIVSSVEILDLNGRVVKSVKVNATQGQISVSDLATGLYMMKISTDQGVATKKIIKE